MRRLTQMVFGTLTVLSVGGCRAATRVTEVPRVDLTLEGGNRGYLVGAPSESGELKTTRQMVETDVEIPSFYRPKRTGTPASLDGIAPPETDVIGGAAEAPPRVFDVYVVQKGDSLWSIAKQPEIYGTATRWRTIFDANRDLLKSPDRVRAGMTLKIPREDSGTTYSDESLTYKK